jgi:uncharacterized membrane protein YedE/YeeE
MPDLLPDRIPWFIAGPTLGLLIVGMFALANKPLGSVGAYGQVLSLARFRSASEPWRIWFFGGILAGGMLAGLMRGDFAFGFGFGALADELPLPALILALLVGGLLMGYGARWGGGCTMGHGLCGSSTRSAGSIAAMMTFMATAVVVTFLISTLIGGAL